jgi:hypothetical protein
MCDNVEDTFTLVRT